MFKWQYLCFMELPRTTPLHPMGEGIDTIMEDWNWDRLSNWPMRLSYCIAIGYNFGSWLILPNNRHIRGGHAGRIPLFLTGHKLKYAESRLERPNWYKADMIWNHQRKCKWPNEATLAGLGEFRRFTSRPVAPKPKPVVVSAGAGLGRLQLQIGSDWYQSLLWKNCIFMNNFGYQQVSTLPSKHCLIFNLFGWASWVPLSKNWTHNENTWTSSKKLRHVRAVNLRLTAAYWLSFTSVFGKKWDVL